MESEIVKRTEFLNDIHYCSPSCQYLEGERESVNKRCSLMNQELDFYDWHLAICEPDEGKDDDR